MMNQFTIIHTVRELRTGRKFKEKYLLIPINLKMSLRIQHNFTNALVLGTQSYFPGARTRDLVPLPHDGRYESVYTSVLFSSLFRCHHLFRPNRPNPFLVVSFYFEKCECMSK